MFLFFSSLNSNGLAFHSFSTKLNLNFRKQKFNLRSNIASIYESLVGMGAWKMFAPIFGLFSDFAKLRHFNALVSVRFSAANRL